MEDARSRRCIKTQVVPNPFDALSLSYPSRLLPFDDREPSSRHLPARGVLPLRRPATSTCLTGRHTRQLQPSPHRGWTGSRTGKDHLCDVEYPLEGLDEERRRWIGFETGESCAGGGLAAGARRCDGADDKGGREGR
jgi:hypothetical protein